MSAFGRVKAQYYPIVCVVGTWAFGCAADGDPIVVSGETLTTQSELEQRERPQLAETDGHDSSASHQKSREHHRDRGRDVEGNDAAECPAACTPHVCTPVKPTNALITDWQNVSPTGLFVDTDNYRQRNASWYNEFFGGPYVYPAIDPCSDAAAPAYPLTQSIGRDWHVQGIVGTWSGFGIWFAPCLVDLSDYRGITLSIWGNVGSTAHLRLDALTHEDSKPNECLTNVGTCDPALYSCKSPSTRIAVPASPGSTVTVLWSTLAGGLPHGLVNASQILGIHLGFERVEWGTEVTAPFPVDVHVGVISLVP